MYRRPLLDCVHCTVGPRYLHRGLKKDITYEESPKVLVVLGSQGL